MEVDLKWERQTTQPDITAVQVQPVPACRVRVTVLNGTSSGGHRVKVEAVMVNAFIFQYFVEAIGNW